MYMTLDSRRGLKRETPEISQPVLQLHQPASLDFPRHETREKYNPDQAVYTRSGADTRQASQSRKESNHHSEARVVIEDLALGAKEDKVKEKDSMARKHTNVSQRNILWLVLVVLATINLVLVISLMKSMNDSKKARSTQRFKNEKMTMNNTVENETPDDTHQLDYLIHDIGDEITEVRKRFDSLQEFQDLLSSLPTLFEQTLEDLHNRTSIATGQSEEMTSLVQDLTKRLSELTNHRASVTDKLEALLSRSTATTSGVHVRLCSPGHPCSADIETRCFKAFKHPALSWPAARRRCEEMGGALAEVRDDPTLQYLRAEVNPGDGLYWLGATGHDNKGEWTWANLRQRKFWTDTSQDLCLGVWRDGWWAEQVCRAEHGFICQRRGECDQWPHHVIH